MGYFPQSSAVRYGAVLCALRFDQAVSGMATIFRATEQRTGRQVAIKVPHPEVESDPALFDRFR